MDFLTSRIDRIQPSVTLEMTAKAADLKRRNKPVYNMSVGEPDFPTPTHIQKAGIFAIQNGYTKYTAESGTVELKKAIQTKFKRDNNLSYNINEIVVSCGGKHSLYNASQVLFEKGDEVIIFSPYWVSFPDFVTVTGATPIFVSTNKRKQYEPNFKELEAKINKKTKGIIINSPSNPTGGVWSGDAILRLLDLCKANQNIWLFSDECYEQLTYNKPFESIASLDLNNKKILTFQSCSKTYAMTGWRIGYIGGDERVVRAVSKLQGQSTSCPNAIAQYAAIAALSGEQTCVVNMRNKFLLRRDLIISQIRTIPNVICEIPDGAFYIFVDFSHYLNTKDDKGTLIENSINLCTYILETTGVVTVPGDSFGAPGHIRFSYATSEEIITQAINLVKKTLLNLSF